MSPTEPDFRGNGARDPYAAFRVPAYRSYLFGWIIAMLGTRIQSVAIGWEMYQRTGDALALGMVGLAQALPTMAFALPAGFLADKFNRPRLMMVSLGLMTLTSLALAWLSYTQGSVAAMYLFLFLDATAVTLGRPARSALMPQLVPKPVFPNAVMWNTSLMQIAAVVGPALGGLVVAFNVPLAYVITAASSLIYMVMLARLKFVHDSKAVGAASFQTLVAGIRFVFEKRIILTMISLDMFAVLLGGAVYLLPIFAEDILQVGATGFGWLRAAPAMGALMMALLLIYLPPMQRAGRTLLLSVAAFGVATIIFGLSGSFWLSFAMLFLTGAFDNISMVIRQTLLQLLTPDYMRGRVSAVNSIFIGASNELGGLESGVVAHFFGPVFSVVSGGIGTLLVVGATALASPELRRYGPLSDAAVDAEAEPPERPSPPAHTVAPSTQAEAAADD
ncbi:MAG: MFS transporter [Caldilineaceae bacterium]|nr:MFS transporter [Caldilineaceae bacterium]